MTRKLGALALLLGAGAPAMADEISGQVSRWQAGVICASQFGNGARPAEDIAFVAQTQVVPAVVGMGFGVRAQAQAPTGVAVTIVVDHPPFTPGGPTQQTYPTTMSGSAMSGFFYRFENQQEAAVGTWRVSALSGQTVLYSLDFDVVPPRANDGLLAACGAG